MKKRIVLIVFLVVQIIGITCMVLCDFAPNTLGPPMWVTALIFLFPGNLLGGWGIETLSWRTHLSLTEIGLLSAVAAIAINALIWFVVVKTVRGLYFRLFARR
jgi:hypothetical protein